MHAKTNVWVVRDATRPLTRKEKRIPACEILMRETKPNNTQQKSIGGRGYYTIIWSVCVIFHTIQPISPASTTSPAVTHYQS